MHGMWVPAGSLLAASVAVALYWYRVTLREHVMGRLERDAPIADDSKEQERPFAVRYVIVPWLAASGTAFGLIFLFDWPVNLAIAFALVIALLGLEADAWIYEWRLNRIESQLADAIDVLIASVGAGASLQASLNQAAEYSPLPLRRELAEMVARLRLGDSPVEVFDLLRQRVPSETFRLFTTTLTVNWQSGGGLSETLSAVGQTIRDRLAIARQIRTLSTQGRLTTLTVLSVIWFMGAMMWQADRPQFERFVASSVGSWLITVSLVLQGIGVALVSRISRPKI